MLYILQYTSNKSYLQLIRVIKYAFPFLAKFFQAVRSFLRAKCQAFRFLPARRYLSRLIALLVFRTLKLWEYIFDMSNYKKMQKKKSIFLIDQSRETS